MEKFSNNSVNVLLPGSQITLGILGGGQLGRMFAMAAKRMGYRVITLDPGIDSPCGQVADEQIVADYVDEKALRQLSEKCNVITYEFENIDARAVEFLESLGKPIHPSSKVLKISQDRLLEKTFLRNAGLAVTEFMPIREAGDIELCIEKIGLPAVIKTVRGGYDGKGQAVVRTAIAAREAFQKLFSGQELIWEKLVPFKKELSVVACRGVDGKAKAYPVSENIHVENILDTGIVPGRVSASAAQKARKMAMQVGEALEIRGTYCVEFFLLDQDEILINEIAPRPHNSGHYTLDACLCSQFEQQVRAICSLPLGSTEILKPSVMVNLIGDGKGSNLEGTNLLLLDPHLSLHLYGKPEAKAKRKMGHFTVVEETVEAAIESAQDLRGLIYWG